jgi:single-stranded-DNA-specific exonuclease
MSKYQKPTLLLQYQSDAKMWAGSGRGLNKSNFTNFKDFINNSKLGFAQGHQGAFGITIPEDKLNEFIDYCNFNLKDYKFTPTYKVDKIFNKEFKEEEILKITEFKGIWGNGIEEPLFAIENISISKDNLKLMSANKNPTLKITLPNGVDLIKFKSSEEEFQQLYSELGCVIINIVGKCERNIWNGIISPQIIIEAYEIVAKTEYYF